MLSENPCWSRAYTLRTGILGDTLAPIRDWPFVGLAVKTKKTVQVLLETDRSLGAICLLPGNPGEVIAITIG
jgi:hypothetical protein